MNKEIIEQIFDGHKLEKVDSIQKIEIGFTNEVYSINDRYILKGCEDAGNEEKFEREVFFYNFFAGKIPVPEITVFDKTKQFCDKHFMIYPKIEGDNLYSKWHLLGNSERKEVIRRLCEILRIINQSSYEEFASKFNIDASFSWHDKITGSIQESLKQIEKKELLSPEFIGAVRKYVGESHSVLNEQKIALVYWDAHFDNILVRNNEIVGILDFERTELSSIDFVLDIVKRMVEYPKKYMSEEFEKFAKKEDYAQLMDWFREFYPEVFEFENLEKRLDMYAIEHDLRDVIGWPDVKEVKEMIAKTIGYSGAH